jgi:hypothetical protein
VSRPVGSKLYPDLSSRTFGKLKVAWPISRTRTGTSYYLTFCECGRHRVVRAVELMCGRIDRCAHEAIVRAHTRHGYTTTNSSKPEYRTWDAMIQRCTNPKNGKWHLYGGRGVKVCKRWMKFDNFIADVGPKPEPKHQYSIDRYPDNNGNYEPGNVRWATWSQQNSNLRNRRKV